MIRTSATKIMWNNVFRPITTDDYDLRFYDCDSALRADTTIVSPIEYFQIGHYAGYDLVGTRSRSSRCRPTRTSRPPDACGCSGSTR